MRMCVKSSSGPRAASDVGLTMPQVALKCADVSHLAADPVLHHKWAIRLEEEMFRQGDLERAKNMAVSPLMDRHSSAGGITRTQAGALVWRGCVKGMHNPLLLA